MVSVSPYKVYLPRQEQIRLLAGSPEKSEITLFMQKVNFDADLLYEHGAIICPTAPSSSLKSKRITLRHILLLISAGLFLAAAIHQANDVGINRQAATLTKCTLNPA